MYIGLMLKSAVEKSMNFKGAGVLPYEPPSEELKTFFRRKYATAFRFVN